MNFLFWNIAGQPIAHSIARLAQLHNLDFIILVESNIEPAVLLKALARQTGRTFHLTQSNTERVIIYSSVSRDFIIPLRESARSTIRHVRLPDRLPFLLGAVHLPSKMYMSESSARAEFFLLSRTIQEVERSVGHERTILVGDFNANPFEHGIVSAAGLNGVLARVIAEKRGRTVQGRQHPFFYNPMWGLLGDLTPGPPGTYFYDRHEDVQYYWNTFDQILIRPDLLPDFTADELEILTTDGATSFLDADGKPDSNAVSDHLPLKFRLI